MNVDDIIKKILNNNIEIKNLFIFTDDYKYIEEVEKKAPEWKRLSPNNGRSIAIENDIERKYNGQQMDTI